MNEIKHIKQLYKEKRYLVNSPTNIDVDSHNVFSQVRKGRTLLICDCCNDTKFCNESPMCRHKKFFIMFPLLRELEQKIENIKLKYEGAKNMNQKVNAFWILDDLEELI